MPIRRQDNTPGGLAAELAKARATYDSARAGVIDRCAQRSNEIAALQVELQAERDELQDVLAAA